MPTPFRLFGFAHLAILAAVPLLAVLFAAIDRWLPPGSRTARLALAVLVFLSSAIYYGYLGVHGSLTFPDHLPLELCDMSLILVIVALVTLNPAVFDIAFYWTLAGASNSLVTPNLPASTTAFLTGQFFASHGLIVTGVLYLVWSGQARPRAGSVGRAMLAVNLYAVFAGTFDYIFKTDYMFLRAKPAAVSLLTVLGPWPWYIVCGEGVALVLFLLLYLPFRQGAAKGERKVEQELHV